MISIIHPSRARPQKAYTTYLEWTTNALMTYEYKVSVDSDDPQLTKYVDLFGHDKLLISNNKSIVDAVNRGAKDAKGDIMIVVSDDFRSFEGWDAAIRMATEGKVNWVLKTYDGLQSWIVTLPIMDRAFYESLGYIYYPNYKHLFCDTELTHVADATGRLIVRNDIVFSHENELYLGQGGGDSLTQRNMRTWATGERLYRKRIAQRFGLKNVNIFNLHPEAKNHLKWISPRFR